MKKLVLFLALLGACVFGVQAQSSYDSAIGLRFGYPVSVSYRTMLNESNALEFTAGTRGFAGYRWISATGAYQIHQSLGETEGLSWYYGGGAGVFIYSFNNDFVGDDSAGLSIGLQGYLGLEYKLANAPINFTLDWVPTFFLGGFGSGFGAGYGSLGVRYIMGSGE